MQINDEIMYFDCGYIVCNLFCLDQVRIDLSKNSGYISGIAWKSGYIKETWKLSSIKI